MSSRGTADSEMSGAIRPAVPSSSRWLNAHNDPLASLYTFSGCMALSDLGGDGDHKLILADLGTGNVNIKLKVFKGTSLISENTVIDLPTSVVAFYMDVCEPRIPAIAVASGPHIYIYKNMRPYFKFTLPSLEVNAVEKDLWSQAREENMQVETLYEMLHNLRHTIGDASLSTRSQRFLALDQSQWHEFFQLHKGHPVKRQTVVTCMCGLKKSMSEDDAVSCLVLGTESQSIYVLDPQAFTILDTMSLPGVPVFMTASGLYDVEFRLVVACRNGHLSLLKRTWKAARTLVELDSQVVGLLTRDKTIVVGLMDDTLNGFSNKGKRQWQVRLPSNITTMHSVHVRQLGLHLVAVALGDQTIQLFRGQYLVDTIQTDEVISALQFGRFGREENALVLVTVGGGLMIKILKRTAHFEEKDATFGRTAISSGKLQVPKKTKLFVDQTMRERENSVMMHRVFQHDLYHLRLQMARAYVNALQSKLSPLSTDSMEPLRLSAQVVGLGPMFKVILTLQNMSATKAAQGLSVAFSCDEKLYSIRQPLLPLPLLVPGTLYQFEASVECISDLGISDHIKVMVLRETHPHPLLTAIINMPVSEAVLVL